MFYYQTAISNNPLKAYFTYRSELLLKPGTRVIVNFGRKKKQLAYIVKQIPKEACPDGIEIKEIDQIIDEIPLIDEDYFSLIVWTADFYLSPPGKVFDLVFKTLGNAPLETPTKKGENQKTIEKNKGSLTKTGLKKKRFVVNAPLNNLSNQRLSQQGMDIIQYLMFFPDANLQEIIRSLELKSITPVQTLIKNNVLTVEEYATDNRGLPDPQKVILSSEQKKIVIDFFKSFDEGKLEHLLYGITGSGKTEVYFEIMDEILSKTQQILFMLPEISLTPQLIKRTKARFPGKTIAVYHSNLTKSMRRKVFTQAVHSDIDILLGTRSSVWLPLKRLGLIVVDEEHDESFMQSENKPVYDARRVVYKLCELKKIPVIFGSATPSVESYYEASTGKMQLHTLKYRPKGLQLPEVSNVNLSKIPVIKGFLTNEVLKGIEETVKKDGQCMILTGKKGFASYVTCGVCGYTIKCPNCDVSLTYHKGEGDLRCHYCGYSQPFVSQCPSCSNNSLVPRGFGSERVEEQLQKLFPDLRIIRIDRDIAPNTQELEKAWKIIERRQVDVVVGTRMISKGLDFPDVQLVVILNADHMLYFPDFRSTERTFSLIHQMSGRAGRARKEAKVILQSYSPDEDPIRFAEKNDFESFFNSEIKKRKLGDYPPFKRIILFESKDPDPDKSLERLKALKKSLEKQNDASLFQILGPVEAFIKKLSGKYRYHMLLKMDNDNDIISKVKDILRENDKHLSTISIIIDPIRTII